MKPSIILLFVLCAAGVCPAVSVSRWFSATFYDLRFTLRRYANCTDLFPLKDYSLNEHEYLVHQIKTFLDQGNYDNEQLANVTALMDNICRSDIDQSYPISVHIDVNKFSNNHTEGKANRCQAIDDALDPMFYVFRRAALNRSEPLDFSVIQYYPNTSDHSAYYNLTDLINTSWIKSETILEHVCNITDSVKRYVQTRMVAAANATVSSTSSSNMADKRTEQQPRVAVFTTIFDMLDRILDPILGLQKRLMWEGTNSLELVQKRISSGWGTIRGGVGSSLKATRGRLTGIFSGSSSASSSLNSTLTTPGLNATNLTTSPNSSLAANLSLPLANRSSTTSVPSVGGNKPTSIPGSVTSSPAGGRQLGLPSTSASPAAAPTSLSGSTNKPSPAPVTNNNELLRKRK